MTSPPRADRAMKFISRALDAYAKGDYTLAASDAAKAKGEASRSPRVRELLGLCHYHAGDYRQATTELQTYRRLTGRSDQNHVIADCHRALGRPEKALEALSQINRREVAPEVWTEAVIVGAGAMADMGDAKKALSHLARGELEPKRVEPHHLRLWYVRAELLEKTGHKKEARALWERIYAEDPSFFDVAERIQAG